MALKEIGSGAFATVYWDTATNTVHRIAEVPLTHVSPLAYMADCCASAALLGSLDEVTRELMAAPHSVAMGTRMVSSPDTKCILERVRIDTMRTAARGDTMLVRRPLVEVLTTEQLHAFARALLEQVAAIHARGLAHRDISRKNVLIAEDGSPMLADFESLGPAIPCVTAPMGEHATEYCSCGTRPPELFQTHEFGGWVNVVTDWRYVDSFSVGAVLFMILFGVGQRPPVADRFQYNDYDSYARQGAVMLRYYAWDEHGVPTRVASDIGGRSDVLAAVLSGLLNKDPRERLSTAAALDMLPAPPPTVDLTPIVRNMGASIRAAPKDTELVMRTLASRHCAITARLPSKHIEMRDIPDLSVCAKVDRAAQRPRMDDAVWWPAAYARILRRMLCIYKVLFPEDGTGKLLPGIRLLAVADLLDSVEVSSEGALEAVYAIAGRLLMEHLVAVGTDPFAPMPSDGEIAEACEFDYADVREAVEKRAKWYERFITKPQRVRNALFVRLKMLTSGHADPANFGGVRAMQDAMIAAACVFVDTRGAGIAEDTPVGELMRVSVEWMWD